MAKVIDLQGVARGDAHLDNALRINPNVYLPKTPEEVAMIEVQNNPDSDKTVLVSIRVPQSLLYSFDAVIRERAYREGKRVTRNSAIVELIETAIQEQQRDGGKAP